VGPLRVRQHPKFVQFQLTINVVALVMTVIGALAGFGEVLTPVQLLWINLIMDAFAALALATEAPTEALLHRKPYSPDAIFISPVMWRNIFSHAALQLAMMCMILFGHEGFFYAKHVKISSVHHYSILFNVFVWLQMWNMLNARLVMDEVSLIDESFFKNIMFWGIMLIMVGFQIIMVEFFGSFAQTHPLSWSEWLWCVAIGFTSVPWGLATRLMPVDHSVGFIDIPKDAFEGADLHLDDDNIRPATQVAGMSPNDIELKEK